FGRPLAERWDGSVWSRTVTPTPPGSEEAHLNGVACTSGTACTAVGAYSVAPGQLITLVEDWNGSKWSIAPTATVLPGTLIGIECLMTSDCTAVGQSIHG